MDGVGTLHSTPATCPLPACLSGFRFEELQYADEASYMQDGKVVFTGKPEDLKAYIRKLGAPV